MMRRSANVKLSCLVDLAHNKAYALKVAMTTETGAVTDYTLLPPLPEKTPLVTFS